MRQVNEDGLQLIKQSEGCKLGAYKDSGGVWTIGYGHTHGVKPGQQITQEQAEMYLLDDLRWAEKAVDSMVYSPLTDNQFAALVSLVYNIGVTAFRMSTILKRLNDKEYDKAAQQFIRWSYDNGNLVGGLQARRMRETELFLRDD